ncbi:ATP-dependent DNA helicase RecG [Cellulomonas alba]|uniref:Probable DNA 3'-5' helicase RecG n=1 Tax=Cellulomonas alba TaxID=3053467 RepID=A0ABT7SCP0_9CELL|nr:ATP-dependent DNA helicase RecG [Cellulomonas alba]MDM7853961.1 ATP-dependent DNA helicase RecG [Cellulomonas alba]
MARGLRYADGVDSGGDRLGEPLSAVLGPALAKRFLALDVHTVGELLRHYPRRYATRGELTELSSLVVGETVSVVARVVRTDVKHARNTGAPRMEVVVTDGQRSLRLTFFARHQGALRGFERSLQPGVVGLFSGQVTMFNGALQLTHPDFELFDDLDSEARALAHADWPVPVYPASAKLDSRTIRRAVRQVLDPLRETDVPDPVPDEVRAVHGLGTLLHAIQQVHVPHSDDDWHAARARLRFEEAFVLQAELARRRARAEREAATARPRVSGAVLDAFDARLPFALTDGQRVVGDEIAADLARPVPMQRLLQGEVGSGKTVVALRAMLQVVDAGGQAALLAPTEVLAAQHMWTLRALLGELSDVGLLGGADIGTRVVLLTGSQGAAVRRESLLDAASGRAGIVVGTHALLSANVQFADLGLVVVDEQHRFGVEQRDVLRSKAATAPHMLVMTATPIPRTVAMTVFGDLETSTLREIPAGRSGVTTHVVPGDRPAWLARTWARVREEVDRGGRAYVVCPRIEGDDPAAEGGTGRRRARDEDGADLVLDDPATVGEGDAAPRRPLRAVLEVADELASDPVLRGVRVGMLHARMSPDEKDRALTAFASGEAPVLVATTVVEVGVDVPAATAMVVLDADHFGLSQLHQLRGRVGRGAAPGVCLLVSGAAEGSPAQARLEALAATTDGFEVAAADLDLRREGDVLGAAQSGVASSLRLLRVAKDAAVIERARADARALVAADPELEQHPRLAAAIGSMLAGDREEFLDRT